MDATRGIATMSLEKVCIVGSGNWGSTIAKIIGYNVEPLAYLVDPDVRLWVHEEIVDGRRLSEIINNDHENIKYLPGIKLPENVRAVTDLAEACDDASILIFVLPHQFLGRALETIKSCGRIRRACRAISLIKGLDANGNGIQMASQLIERSLGINCSVMMGANLANEIAMEMFCESTIGSHVESDGITFKRLLETSYFKLNVVPEVISVELCGALKNIVAIGAGFVDGMLMGDNTKAAVIRIGLDEMRRFSRLFAPDSPSESGTDNIFFESCGVADLITSCFGGRNRRIGEAHVTTSKPIEQLETELLGGQKLQGPPAALEVYKFLKARNAESQYPLMTAIYQICFEGYPPQHLIQNISK